MAATFKAFFVVKHMVVGRSFQHLKINSRRLRGRLSLELLNVGNLGNQLLLPERVGKTIDAGIVEYKI